jgi:hypothetical protein
MVQGRVVSCPVQLKIPNRVVSSRQTLTAICSLFAKTLDSRLTPHGWDKYLASGDFPCVVAARRLQNKRDKDPVCSHSDAPTVEQLPYKLRVAHVLGPEARLLHAHTYSVNWRKRPGRWQRRDSVAEGSEFEPPVPVSKLSDDSIMLEFAARGIALIAPRLQCGRSASENTAA